VILYIIHRRQNPLVSNRRTVGNGFPVRFLSRRYKQASLRVYLVKLNLESVSGDLQ
jgi:hypothetical protein